MKYLFLALLSAFVLLACKNNKQLFRTISPEKSGIDFVNQITESPNLNILNYEYLYNGGGIGIGDFNNDSLPDVYFIHK
jgi:hypothetical protein